MYHRMAWVERTFKVSWYQPSVISRDILLFKPLKYHCFYFPPFSWREQEM